MPSKKKLLSSTRRDLIKLRRGNSTVRFDAVHRLKGAAGEQVTTQLIRGLRDRSLTVRSECAHSVIARGKIKEAVAAFAKTDFSKLSLSGPKTRAIDRKKIVRARAERMAELRKAKAKGKEAQWRQKYEHRGVQIYLVKGLGFEAMNLGGRILIDKGIPVRFRKIFAEHELFELVNHQIAMGAELLYAKEQGQLMDYMRWMQQKKSTAFRERSAFAQKHFAPGKS